MPHILPLHEDSRGGVASDCEIKKFEEDGSADLSGLICRIYQWASNTRVLDKFFSARSVSGCVRPKTRRRL